MSSNALNLRLHPKQDDFVFCDKPLIGYRGGRGSGKSKAGAARLLIRAASKPGLYGAYAPTYPVLRDTSLRSFLEIAGPFIDKHNHADNLIRLINGAEIIFRSLDNPETGRGPNLSGAWIDEAQMVDKLAFAIILGCLREGGDLGWLAATFTPRGPKHWTTQTFVNGERSALFISRTMDNPFLDREFISILRQQYTSQFAAQEIDAQIIDMEGSLCRREWFQVVDDFPREARLCRGWDQAATEKTTADYLAGVRIGVHQGIYYVTHVIRTRVGPGAVDKTIIQTAETDGKACMISLEQEPGSGGKISAHDQVTKLAGFDVTANPQSKDKVVRIMPFLRQAEVGNVKIVRSTWNADYIDEFCEFPAGEHDDQVDATGMAFQRLTDGLQIFPSVGGADDGQTLEEFEDEELWTVVR